MQPGSLVTIAGSAVDSGGGRVGGVEVSVDGGVSWHPASGRETWTYSWTPTTSGSARLISRAVDDSGNVETPGAGMLVNVGQSGSTGPCSIWNATTVPSVASADDTESIELGVKFRSSVNGYVKGICFYKESGNSGVHTGSLWSSSGTRLATATFTNETASGWQQVDFATPVSITAGTVYVASYFAPAGRYSYNRQYFSTSGVTAGSLYLLRDGEQGGNGVYAYGSSSVILLSQARSLPEIVLLSGLAGWTGELYRPASGALLADLVPAGQRVTAFSAYRMALNAGFAFGPATAGLLAKTSFVWLFVGDAFSSILFGLVAWFGLPAGLRGERAAGSLLATFRILRSDRRLIQVLAASLAGGLVFVQVFSSMSLAITGSGFSPSVYGFMISLNGALVVLFELPITALTGRFTARRVMAVGYVLIGLGFASNMLPRSIALLVFTTVVFTVGAMISMQVGDEEIRL